MTGTILFFLNVSLGIVFFFTFCGAWALDRSRRDALFWVAAFVFALISAGFEYSLRFFEDAYLPRFALFGAHLTALMFYSAGVGAHFGKAFPWRPVLIGWGIALAINLAIMDMPRESLVRQILYQGPYFLMAMVAVLQVYAYRREKAHILFLVATGCFAAQFALRPVLAVLLGGQGMTPALYLGTTYGAASQLLMAVTTMFTAAIMAGLVVREVVRGLRMQALSDARSGLATQQGFAVLAEQAFAKSGMHGGQPVIAVLEAQEEIAPGIHASASGASRYPEALASALLERADPDCIPARLGENRFAVLFGNGTPQDAEGWCQGLREHLKAEGLRPGRGPLVFSSGICRRRDGEPVQQLVDRATEALYQAGRFGGNRDLIRDLERYVVPRKAMAM